MGKRSAFFASTLLIAGLVQLNPAFAPAQSSATPGSDCGSGILSSVDGTCMSADQSPLGLDQQSIQLGGQPGGLTGDLGSSGQGLTAGQLSQQYPGLQSQGMNTRIPNFYDSSGLPPSAAETQALSQERALARQSVSRPTEFQRLAGASLGALLPIYGDSLFQVVPSTFAPVLQIPVTSDYVIGPGDQLVVRIWGQVNFNSELTVDRSGAVYLPQVGEIHVAGLPYSQIEEHLRQAVGRIYKNFNVEVELGQLRAIQVFVVGQARRPGSYTLSSLSTLVTAIFATGGPSVQGSLRDIQLKRNGQTITHFDLYDLLVQGDKSKDVALLAGDVIYIPPVGPQVAVAGSVRYPAIYEFAGSATVGQILGVAGGLSTTASVQRASLERITAHKDREVMDIALQGSGLETPLREGDILRVLPISPRFESTVTLRGNVAEPGRFSWHPGMRLSEILPNSQSLITRDYWEQRNRLGILGPEFKPEDATNPDLYLRTPGGYSVSASNLSNAAGTGPAGPNASQSAGIAEAARVPGAAPGAAPGSANQAAAYQAAAGQANAQNAQPPQVQSNMAGQSALGGAAANTGNARKLPRPPLDVQLPVPEIDWSYAAIERFNPQTLTTSLVPFNPGALVLDHDSAQDLLLEPGDVVTIFSQADIRVPQAERTKYVRLEGEFKQAGIYTVRPGETLRSLVERAGGLTPAAYLFGSDFTRVSTQIAQQQRLNDYLQQLELEIDRASISAAAGAISPLDTAAAASEQSAAQTLVAKFRTLRASGRIVLNVSPGASSVASIPDLPLEDGDRFDVPSKPSTVNVVGAVYNENAFLFQQTQRVGGYLRLAGGATRDADGKHSFIIRADGSVVSRDAESGVFGNTFAESRLYPGDTVVVPEKVPKQTALRNINNLTGIFSQLALGAAAIAVVR